MKRYRNRLAFIVLVLIAAAAVYRYFSGHDLKRDITYAKVGKRELKLDIYIPRYRNGKLPVAVNLHGGGWCAGSKLAVPFKKLLLKNFIVFSPEYRLAPKDLFPAQLDDVCSALKWIDENATGYGADNSRILIYGGSAGGHLALLAGLKCPENIRRKIKTIGAFGAPTDLVNFIRDTEKDPFDNVFKNAGNNHPIKLLLGCHAQECPEKALAASPINAIDSSSKEIPAIFLAHGTADHVVPFAQAENFADVAQKTGHQLIFYPVKDGQHINFDLDCVKAMINLFN
jgi:acetyl esterase/lipase